MSKFKKFLLFSVVLFFLLITSLFMTVVHMLPSPQKIARALKTSSASEKESRVEIGKEPREGDNTAVRTNEGQETELNNENSRVTEDKAEAEKKSRDTEQVRRLLDENPRDLHVCENLGKTKFFNKENPEKNKFDIGEIFGEENKEDSVAQTIRFPIRAIFQDPSISPLLHEILDLSKKNIPHDEEKSFLEKINFYSRVTYAAAQLYNKKSEFEYLGNRAQHLQLIAQIAAQKPELANDSGLRNFCESLQNSIINGQKIDLIEERKEILKLISYSGLTNQQLGFNPNNFIKFSIHSDKTGFRFSLSSKDEESAKK